MSLRTSVAILRKSVYKGLRGVRLRHFGEGSGRGSDPDTLLVITCFPWIQTKWFLSQLKNNGSSNKSAYQDYLNKKMTDNDQAEFDVGNNGSSYLGDDAFIIETEGNKAVLIRNKTFISLEDIIISVSKEYHIEKNELHLTIRSSFYMEIISMIAWIATELDITTLRKVARYFSKDETCLSREIKRIRIQNNKKMREIASQLKSECRLKALTIKPRGTP